MPSEEKLSQFNEALKAIIKFKDKDLISRNEWGKLNFKEIEDDINIAIQLADDFNSFSNKYLTRDCVVFGGQFFSHFLINKKHPFALNCMFGSR